MINVKFLTGSKENIDSQIEMGVIDKGDVIFTSDTDEIVFYNPQSEKRVIQSKTQNEYVLKGTDLGGLKEGDVINEGTSLDELLKLITTKVIPAEYKQPAIVLVSSDKTEYEAGTSVSVLLQSQFIQNDAGKIKTHVIMKNGQVIYDGNAVSPIGASDNFIISDGAVIFESQASYEAGTIKNNNLGEASPEGAISAGFMNSRPIYYYGYRNLFFGKGTGELPELTSENIRNLSDSMLNPQKKDELSIDMLAGEQYVIFAYPSHLGDVQNITYVQGNDTNMAPSFTKQILEVEGANGYSAIEYNVYTYKTAIPVAAKTTFKIIL